MWFSVFILGCILSETGIQSYIQAVWFIDIKYYQ